MNEISKDNMENKSLDDKMINYHSRNVFTAKELRDLMDSRLKHFL